MSRMHQRRRVAAIPKAAGIGFTELTDQSRLGLNPLGSKGKPAQLTRARWTLIGA